MPTTPLGTAMPPRLQASRRPSQAHQRFLRQGSYAAVGHSRPTCDRAQAAAGPELGLSSRQVSRAPAARRRVRRCSHAGQRSRGAHERHQLRVLLIAFIARRASHTGCEARSSASRAARPSFVRGPRRLGWLGFVMRSRPRTSQFSTLVRRQRSRVAPRRGAASRPARRPAATQPSACAPYPGASARPR